MEYEGDACASILMNKKTFWKTRKPKAPLNNKMS